MQINGSTINDAPVNDETAVFGVLKTNTLQDAVSLVDSGRELVWDVIFERTISLLEQLLLVRISTVNRTVTENVALIEQLLRSTIRGRFTGDTIVTLDFSPLTRLKGVTTTEFVSVVDAVIKQKNLTRQLSEALILVDQIIGQRVKPGFLTESISLTDIGRLLVWDVTFDASISVAEQLIKVMSGGASVVTRVATDTFLITDGTVRQIIRGRTLIDAIVADDTSAGREVTQNVSVTETLDVSDSFLLRRLRQFVTTEGLTLVDFLFNSSSSTRTIITTDSVVVFDQQMHSTLRNRLTSENIAVNESTAKALQRLMTLVDSIVIVDNSLRLRMWDTRVGETITLSDETSKTILRAVLYDVRVILGVGIEPVLGAYDSVILGAYN